MHVALKKKNSFLFFQINAKKAANSFPLPLTKCSFAIARTQVAKAPDPIQHDSLILLELCLLFIQAWDMQLNEMTQDENNNGDIW